MFISQNERVIGQELSKIIEIFYVQVDESRN